MDTAILDCGHNCGYNRIVMFPVTNISDATNESNFLSQRLECVNRVGALINSPFSENGDQKCNFSQFFKISILRLSLIHI